MTTPYIALIGDLVASKSIENRDDMQSKIQTVFDQLNQTYQAHFVSKLTLTLGDEFQVLMQPNKAVWQLIDDLQRLIPHPIRFGIGYGEITTEINPDISLGADGPAYWHARKAINQLKDHNWNGILRQQFIGRGDQDDTINTILLLTDTIRANWTQTQAYVFNGLLAEGIYQGNFSQRDLAPKLDLSESALSKRLNSGHIKIYLQGRTNLGQLLEVANDEQ
ncbi:SatD protein [Aerococcus agrisoli]|uniref:SatD protein n=1 Tax=Aerococcus agrisoli TaxID=2487350 RepID=A0A3N4GL58_9LACT|nr:SatD family protein [Aerococcus agrisoli]RPA59851.1 SatD protein [Aerococcus agrisoli]